MNRGTFRALGHLAAVVALWGCEGASSVETEPNDLGITRIQIDRADDRGTHVLSIHGLAEDGQELALATLRTGTVYVEPEWTAPGWTTGSDLTITVGTQRFRDVTPGLQPFTLLEPDQAAIASFVRLSEVSAAIRDDAGIRFSRRTEVRDEVAFRPLACDPATFPSGKGNPPSCCQETTGGITRQYYKVANGGKLAMRTVGAAGACADANGNHNCNGMACAYGPCGTKLDTGSPFGDSNAKVFTPTSQSTVCGYDDDGTGTTNAHYAPEVYTNQVEKFGVTASCPYIDCDNGVPVTTSNACGYDCFLNELSCCQSNSTCFVAGTQVTMADGTTREIEKLQVGDSVMAYDVELGVAMPSHVTQTFVHENSAALGTVLVNGTLRSTPNHPFYANGKWVRADELSAGDMLIGFDGQRATAMTTPMTLDTLQSMAGAQTVYNIEVDTLHDYFAGGVLVHNKVPVCDCAL